mgnify:CR=1 FL=1
MSQLYSLNRLAKGLLGLAASFALTSAAEAARTPNFVLIFMDDQGYQDVGVFGSKTIKTPNLDNMAKEGMKGFQEFMVKPEREKQIRQRIERARKRIYKQ